MIAYIALFSALLSRLIALVSGSAWVTSFYSAFLFCFCFLISTEVVYLQRWHGWCHMKLQPSRTRRVIHDCRVIHDVVLAAEAVVVVGWDGAGGTYPGRCCPTWWRCRSHGQDDCVRARIPARASARGGWCRWRSIPPRGWPAAVPPSCPLSCCTCSHKTTEVTKYRWGGGGDGGGGGCQKPRRGELKTRARSPKHRLFLLLPVFPLKTKFEYFDRNDIRLILQLSY